MYLMLTANLCLILSIYITKYMYKKKEDKKKRNPISYSPHHRDRLYLEEFMGSVINFKQIDGACVMMGSSENDQQQQQQREEGNSGPPSSLGTPGSARWPCSVTTHDSGSLDEQLAHLTVIDVGEM